MKNGTLIKIVVVTCACIVALFALCPAYAEHAAEAERAELEHGEFFPKLVIVISKAKVNNQWLISCEDREGNIWGFWDEEGTWERGDIANLLMWSIGDSPADYEIINVYWEGYTENIRSFFQTIEWR